jgi:hypothetical protein
LRHLLDVDLSIFSITNQPSFNKSLFRCGNIYYPSPSRIFNDPNNILSKHMTPCPLRVGSYGLRDLIEKILASNSGQAFRRSTIVIWFWATGSGVGNNDHYHGEKDSSNLPHVVFDLSPKDVFDLFYYFLEFNFLVTTCIREDRGILKPLREKSIIFKND